MTVEPDRAQVARIATAFAGLLRAHGLDVPVGAVITFVDALGEVGIDDRQAVYWAGRATLIQRPEDRKPYDSAFGVFWLQREPIHSLRSIAPPLVVAFDDDEAGDGDESEEGPEAGADSSRTLEVRWSPTEVLRHKDFANYTHSEFDEARQLMADLRLSGALRRSRRLRPVHGRRVTHHRDLRRTVHRAVKLHGEPVHRASLEPAWRPRRLILLCDVSGSMESYSRALLRFLHAAVVARRHTEVFALGTRLTRLTRELSSHDPDAALAAAGRAVTDWSGGTRLGAAVREFNDRYGARGMARGAVVVILSDGWDRGEPGELAEQMARLRRVTHRVVWVNPLKASPGYAPLARGMAAALPFVDEFVEGHSVASLERLAEVVSRP